MTTNTTSSDLFYAPDGSIIEPPESMDAFSSVYDRNDKGEKFAFKYPLHDESRHYIKFWIHADEQSKIFKAGPNGAAPEVEDLGYVDNSDQNRLNRGLTSVDAIGTAGAIAGAVSGATVAVKRLQSNEFKANNSAGVIASLSKIAETAAGGAAGYLISGILAEKFNLTKRLKKVKNTIDIYTPAGISANYNMKWNMTDDQLINFAQSDTMDSIGKNITSASSMGKVLEMALIGGSTAAQNLTRTALNKRKDVLFQNVENRTFRYEFQMAARSQAEAKMIDTIIFLFKFYSHPEVLEGYGQFLALYPAEFKIEYYFINDDGKHVINPYLNKISSCVCTGVNVSYASNGSYQSLMNGEPTVVNLSLSFMEIETLHQDRIRKGY